MRCFYSNLCTTYDVFMLSCILLVVACPNLPAPANGTIACSLGDDGVATEGDTCSYTCNTRSVNITRTSGIDGMWNSSEPVCICKEV